MKRYFYDGLTIGEQLILLTSNGGTMLGGGELLTLFSFFLSLHRTNYY